jgi:hypothetical protein
LQNGILENILYGSFPKIGPMCKFCMALALS